MQLGKQAACLRTVGDRNPDPRVAELELELMKLGNAIGMGAMGFVGSGMVVDCHIECGYAYRRHANQPAHVLPVVAPRHRAHPRRQPHRISNRSAMVHPHLRRETVEW